MPRSAFTSNFSMYDITAVENLFLLEFMPYAPGDYVKVYLYGLMLCRHGGDHSSLASMAASLNMGASQALDAMAYWEQKGLVIRLSDSPPSFEYLNVRSAIGAASENDNEAYAFSDFNDRLQSIFGLLQPQQFRMAMEWVEDLKLPKDVVLFMAEKMNAMLTLKNGGKQRSLGYSFKAMNDRALKWADMGVNTLDAARREVARELPPYQLAVKLIGAFGARRNPTQAEVALAEKWMNEWGLAEDDVLNAFSETTKSASPSFGYLDGILKNRRARGGDETTREAVKAVLAALGAPARAATDDLTEAYAQLIEQGFEHEIILRAAAQCNGRGQHTFEKLTDVLSKWLSLKLTTPGAVEAYLARRAQIRKLTLTVFDKAGISREPTDADLDQTQDWLSVAGADMIEYAAECARGLSIPARSITKRLSEWAEAGVKDIDKAKAFTRPRPAKGEKTGEKAPPKNPALNYDQRTYDDAFYENLFVDLTKARKESK